MLNVYLSGEIHTNWREEIIQLCEKEKLKLIFLLQQLIMMHLIIVVLKYLVMRRKIFGRIIKGQRLILLKLKNL